MTQEGDATRYFLVTTAGSLVGGRLTKGKNMDSELRKALCDNLTVSVETAARAFGMSRNPAYEACRSGQIPSLRIGRKIVVPTAPLRKMLGIEAA